MNENGTQKKLVKGVRVVSSESQCAPKHDGLVATDRMRRVEAVIREFADVDECVFGVWKKHVVIVARVASRLTTPSSATAEAGALAAWWGGKAAAEAASVTAGAVRCSA